MENMRNKDKNKWYCKKCGMYMNPRPDSFTCVDCNHKLRVIPRATNNGPNSIRRMRVDEQVPRY